LLDVRFLEPCLSRLFCSGNMSRYQQGVTGLINLTDVEPHSMRSDALLPISETNISRFQIASHFGIGRGFQKNQERLFNGLLRIRQFALVRHGPRYWACFKYRSVRADYLSTATQIQFGLFGPAAEDANHFVKNTHDLD